MRRSFAHMAPLALTALCTIAVHQHPAAATPVPDAKAEAQRLTDRPINAALLYHRLWTLHDSRIALFNEATAREELDFENPEWVPDEALSEILKNLQPYIRDLLVVAEQPEADWGIEYSKGVEALLPHLGQLRRVELALRADARRLAAAGEDEAAADRIVALHRLSTQSRRNGILISALVNNSMGMRASMDTRILAVVYEIGPDARAKLLRAIDALPHEDRHGIEYAVAIEPPFFADYIRRTFNEERPGERIIESLMIEDESDIAWVRALTRSSLERELELYEQFGREAVKAWNDPEVLVRLGELSRKLESGEYGRVAKHLAPEFARVRQQAERAERDLQRARAALLQEDD
ncbi:MAG: hypothetical protein JJU33_06370 [Phycisphaerales bacterium]|nr:hypothetical protein [Phycisphaerales bacterium]